jgi:hypothetical protein
VEPEPNALRLDKARRRHHQVTPPNAEAHLDDGALVEALRILHAQGLVHGRLDKRAVVSEGADQADFLLSGFEWSLRLSAEERSHAAVAGKASARRPRSYSFAGDWARLGDFVADLLGVHVRRSGEVANDPDGDAMPLTLAERALLKRMVAPSKDHGVDADAVSAGIEDILSYAPHGDGIQSGTFILVFDGKSGLVHRRPSGINACARRFRGAWVRSSRSG